MNNILHQNVRAKLMALLVANEELTFKMIKEELNLSDGNLSSHLKKLQLVNYIQIKKNINNKTNKTQTTLMITQEGSKEFKAYIKDLKEFIQSISIQELS